MFSVSKPDKVCLGSGRRIAARAEAEKAGDGGDLAVDVADRPGADVGRQARRPVLPIRDENVERVAVGPGGQGMGILLCVLPAFL